MLVGELNCESKVFVCEHNTTSLKQEFKCEMHDLESANHLELKVTLPAILNYMHLSYYVFFSLIQG